MTGLPFGESNTDLQWSSSPDDLLTDTENDAIRANESVKAAFREAWIASEAADPEKRYEEGGFIVRRGGGFAAVPLPSGTRFSLPIPPLESGRKYRGEEVVATYHTHPTPKEEPGGALELEPSEADEALMTRFPEDSYIITRKRIILVNRKKHRFMLVSSRSFIGI